MNRLFAAALEIQRFLQDRSWRACIIGGLAVLRWGHPRATQDIDFSLLAEFGGEEPFVDAMLAEFSPRIGDARDFALSTRVLLLTASNGVPIDIALAGIPYEERMIDRATPFDFSTSVRLVTVSAEDLVVLKTFAGRDQDWADLAGILARQSASLDWTYILKEIAPLCESIEDPERVARLTKLRTEITLGN